MRRWSLRLVWILWALIVALVALTHLCGQCWWPTGMMVYAPPQMWLVFLAGVAVAGWRLDRRLSWLCLFTALLFVGPLWGYRTHRPWADAARLRGVNALRVLTVNRGDHHEHSVAGFVTSQEPDLIAMQDSIYARAWKPGAPEYAALTHQSRVSEFLLLSRHPIRKSELLKIQLPPVRQPSRFVFKAARFEIDFNGKAVAIYNIHLPSPRQDMRRLAGTPSASSIATMNGYWQEHAAIIKDLLSRIESETMPTLVLGDWNQPTVGPYYRQLTRVMQDAHTLAGSGFGWTFPGDWWTVFTGSQEWMRLDLILCSKEWLVLRSEVEPESESQHCAVSAVVELR